MQGESKAECGNFPSTAPAQSTVLPECCNSGCTVCVLDYPELFMQADSETLALLEAVEQAEKLAAQMTATESANTESNTGQGA